MQGQLGVIDHVQTRDARRGVTRRRVLSLAGAMGAVLLPERAAAATAQVSGPAPIQLVTATIDGDGTTSSFAIAHNLSNQYVVVQVVDATTTQEVFVDIDRTDANTVTVAFGTAPAPGESYVVMVIG